MIYVSEAVEIETLSQIFLIVSVTELNISNTIWSMFHCQVLIEPISNISKHLHIMTKDEILVLIVSVYEMQKTLVNF